jgi:hypothetical protein
LQFSLGSFRSRWFIAHSSNKSGGTGESAEHRQLPFVVGRAVQIREEESL